MYLEDTKPKGYLVDIEATIDYMDSIAIQLYKSHKIPHPIILILYVGESVDYVAPMPLDPEPPVNFPVLPNFPEIYNKAVIFNPALEDGAILIKVDEEYPILTGWGYRIFAPPLAMKRRKNVGSGYHSALDISMLDNVVAVYLIKPHRGIIYRFVKGEEEIILKE